MPEKDPTLAQTPLTDVGRVAPATPVERAGPALRIPKEGLAVLEGVARIFGAYGALAASLLYLRAHIPKLLALLARVKPMPPMRMDIVVWRTEPPTQTRTYLIVVLVVGLVALTHASILRVARRLPLAVVCFEALVLAIAATLAFQASPFLGEAFVLGLLPIAALFAPFALPSRERIEPVQSSAALTVALALQSIPLAWGAWITTFTLPTGAILGAQIAAWSFSLWRATQRGRTEDEVLAGLPFTVLPIVGLLRAPRAAWLLVPLAAYGAIRMVLQSGGPLAQRVRRMPARVIDLAVVASFWGTCAVFTIPYRFRDLPRLNHNSHETGAYATVNSILHGRLMMADAGLIYGPLRSYALTLYALVAGVTAEQIRAGQAVINHAMLFVLLALGWRLVDRRLAGMAWYVFLLLVASLSMLWVNYAGENAFGWADLGRIGFPFLATIGGVAGVIAVTRGGELTRRGAVKLAGWGALAGVSTLWAQEFGTCAIVALVCVPAVHFLLADGALSKRARVAALSVGSMLAGAFATLGLYVLVYALEGRAGLFLRTVTEQSAAFASGSYGSLPFPTNEGSFLRWQFLASPAGHKGIAIEYAIPVGVYLFAMVALAARAFSSRWSDRDTITLGTLVFGVTSFLFALGRTDYIHLATVTLPAIALVPRLTGEATRAVYASRPATVGLRALGAATAIGLALASLNISGIPLALGPRLNNIFSGYERPSSGPAYSYPGVPRAGDVKVEPEYIALVEAIDAHSTRADKIFQHIGYMDGGEVYFLADRANPTRYDLLAEFLTTERQHIAYEAFVNDPPKLIVGDDWGCTGPELNDYMKSHYRSIGKYGSWDLLQRSD